MNLSNAKKHLEFILITIMFTITSIFIVYIYFSWNKELNKSEIEKQININVNLPIVDWNKYSNLSKQLSSDIVD